MSGENKKLLLKEAGTGAKKKGQNQSDNKNSTKTLKVGIVRLTHIQRYKAINPKFI